MRKARFVVPMAAGTCYDYSHDAYLAALGAELPDITAAFYGPDFRRSHKHVRAAMERRFFREAFAQNVLSHSRIFFARKSEASQRLAHCRTASMDPAAGQISREHRSATEPRHV